MLLGDHLDYVKYEARQMVLQNLSTAPSSPSVGQAYYDTTLGLAGFYTAGGWIYVSTGVATAITRAAVAAAAGELIVSAGADRSAQSFTTNGLLKIAAGVVASALAGTDYVTPTGAETLTNKTLNAASNSISNLTLAMFAAGVVDTDTTLAANSDTKVASQKATKAYVDNKVINGVNMMGTIDASTNPNYPAAAKGDMYKISVAGKIGGASGPAVSAGDAIVAITANAGGTDAAVGASWDVIQANVDQATTTVLGLLAIATQAETEAKTVSTKAVVPSDLANFTQKKPFTIGDGAALSYALTHSLGTQDVSVTVRDATTNELILTKWIANSTSQVTVYFGSAPALNSRKVVVIG